MKKESVFDRWVPQDLSALVPEEYAEYREPLREALVYFLDRLGETRQQEVLAYQLALPEDAPPLERVMALLYACPSLHKLGQVVARDRRLSEELRGRLQELESLPGAVPLDELRRLVSLELGTAAETIELEPPLAEGSVCVVVPFRRGSRQKGPTEPDGVLKVVKPGVERKLEEELGLWSGVGERLEAACRRHGLVTPDWEDAVGQVAELLQSEVQLDCEQAHIVEAAEFFGDDPWIEVPELLPDLCTDRLTAMTRLPGSRVTDFTGHRLASARLAARVVEGLVARPVLSARGSAIFHADPHAGNLLATMDGRLGVVDWSLIGRLSKDDRVQVAQIVVGAMTLDARRISRAIERLSRGQSRWVDVRSNVHDALAEVRRGRTPGFGWVAGFLDRLAVSQAARFPSHLLLFRKSLLTLEGVVADISEDVPADLVLGLSVARQGLADAPRRLLASPFSREFGSQLSNADLLSIAFTAPLTGVRYWQQTLYDRLVRA